eukprot:6188513-Prorocentrum_lima.AAC.1
MAVPASQALATMLQTCRIRVLPTHSCLHCLFVADGSPHGKSVSRRGGGPPFFLDPSSCAPTLA